MGTQYFVRVLITCFLNLVYIIVSTTGLKVKPERVLLNNELCQKMAGDPYFEPEMVIGKPWRIYYTWDMDLEKKCLDMTFKAATPMIIQRMYNDMSEHLETQPTWGAALLLLTLGAARHEMLLLADQGPAGRLLAIPNMARDGQLLIANRHDVPLLKFQMKVVQGGKYLVVMDCSVGVTSLLARADDPPYRSQLEEAAAALRLGEGGAHACVQDKNENENQVYSEDKRP